MEQQIIQLRQKYVDRELAHFRHTGEKSIKLRAKVSVLTELMQVLEINHPTVTPKKKGNSN